MARLVRNTLCWSPFLEDVAFEVTAEEGIVTLTGVSPYPSLGRMAATLAWTIPGVRAVVNDIRIRSDMAHRPAVRGRRRED